MALLKHNISNWQLINFLFLKANPLEEGTTFLSLILFFCLEHIPLFIACLSVGRQKGVWQIGVQSRFLEWLLE